MPVFTGMTEVMNKLLHSSSPSIVPRQRRALQKQACSRFAFFVCFSPICKL
jgi:hypothetical protein